jgi:hypothetical protein
MALKLIYEITIGDIISVITVGLYCLFTYLALKQTGTSQRLTSISMERPRIIELLRVIISPTIVNLGEIIRNIEKGIAHYDRVFITIEDTYKDELILSEFKDKYPEILNDIKELDSICKSAKEKYNELHNIIFEEIKDESIKMIKEFNVEKSNDKYWEVILEGRIPEIVKQEFSYYILGAAPSSSSMKYIWNKQGEQLSKVREKCKVKKKESSIEEDVNKIREMIEKIEPRLTEKRDSLMKEYGIEPRILKQETRCG